MAEIMLVAGTVGCFIGVPMGCDGHAHGWVLVCVSAFLISLGRKVLGL